MAGVYGHFYCSPIDCGAVVPILTSFNFITWMSGHCLLFIEGLSSFSILFIVYKNHILICILKEKGLT